MNQRSDPNEATEVAWHEDAEACEKELARWQKSLSICQAENAQQFVRLYTDAIMLLRYRIEELRK